MRRVSSLAAFLPLALFAVHAQKLNVQTQIKGQVPAANGGLGIDTSNALGCPKVVSGVWSISQANCATPFNINSVPSTGIICGTGITCTTANGVVTITAGGTSLQPAAAPYYSVASGAYPSPLSVSITSAANGVTHYTTDGTNPTASSPTYSAALSFTANTVLKAYTSVTGFLDSAITAATYTITNPTGAAHMELASMGQDGKMKGAMPFIGSAAYANVSGFAVDTANNQYVQTAVGGSKLDTSQPTDPAGGITYYVLNSKTDPTVYWVSGQTDYDATGQFDAESDHAMIPMKPGILGESGRDITTCYDRTGTGDIHGEIIDVGQAEPVIYDMYNVRTCNGVANYYSLSVRNLNHPFETQGPKGRTSGDVAGMEIMPPILGMDYEDYDAGAWKHAARWTMHLASKAPNNYATLYTGMGSHGGCGGGNCSGVRATTFGQRMRLKASVSCVTDPSGVPWNAQDRITCQGMKNFGLINADNGINMAVQGGYSSKWTDPTPMHQLGIDSFEAIVDPTAPGAYAAQVIDEDETGGTSTVIDQTNIFNYSDGAGPVIPNPVPRPTIVSFTPSATTVQIGQPVTFTWSATNATVVMIDHAGGTGWGNTGSITWVPTQTDTYRLTVLGTYGWRTGAPITVTVTGPQGPAPTSSVPTGTYTTPQNVALSNTLQGSQIHYTLDGTTPGKYSTLYSGPISVSNPQTVIKSVTTAVSQGFLDSPVTTTTITLNLPSAGAPTYSPAAGSYPSAVSAALSTTTSGAGIYYSTDGSPATASSAFYSAPIAVPFVAGVQTRTQINAATIKYGYASAYSSATYLVGTQGALNGVAGTGQYVPTYTTGKFGQGLVGGGTATPPAGFSPLNSTDGYTVDAWVKTPTAGGLPQQIIGNSDDTSNGFAIVSRYGNLTVYGPGVAELNSGLPISDNAVHYVKATYCSDGIRTFVDGVAGATTSSVAGSVPAGNLGIGWKPGRGFYWSSAGFIDEVRIRTGCDNSLTVPTGPSTGTESGTFGLWHLTGDLTDSTVR